MDTNKTKLTDELKRQFPHLSLAEAYSILSRHDFKVDAAVKELQAPFVASAADHGVVYETPPAPPSADTIRNTMDELFRQRRSEEGSEGQAFVGSGRRLGHTEAPSPVIPAAVRQQRTVTVTVYSNEIRIDGGSDVPVKSIPLESVEAKAFMDAMKAGVVPPSLDDLYPNCELHVELQDRMNREYQPPAATFTAFQDQGHSLAPAPSAAAVAAASSAGSSHMSYDPDRTFHLDDNEESTIVRLVSTSGAQTELKVNSATHTVEDLYFLAHQAEPNLHRFVLEVRDMPPRKLGPETRTKTIAEAKLKRTVIVVRSL